MFNPETSTNEKNQDQTDTDQAGNQSSYIYRMIYNYLLNLTKFSWCLKKHSFFELDLSWFSLKVSQLQALQILKNDDEVEN